jgi:5-methylthioadenosine/S-adenosylhomocysteine deaminase
MFDSQGVRFRPKYDPVSSVVYSASDTDVCMTLIGGDIVYENGKVTFADVDKVYEKMEKYAGIYKG